MEARPNMKDEPKNGNHFLALLKSETLSLNKLVHEAEQDLILTPEEVIPEEIKGKMRIAVGKSKMLLTNKFQLFHKLCLKNLGIKSDVRYPVTVEDLAGYWETILMQIRQVYNIFEEVEGSRRSNWKPIMEPIINQKGFSQEKLIKE